MRLSWIQSQNGKSHSAGQSRSTIALILIAMGGLMLLSLWGTPDSPGPALLRRGFGWGGSIIGLAILGAGVLLLVGPRYFGKWRWEAVIGLELALIAALGLTSLRSAADDVMAWALAGGGGGLVGWAFGFMPAQLLGTSVTALLLVGLLVAGLGMFVAWGPIPVRKLASVVRTRASTWQMPDWHNLLLPDPPAVSELADEEDNDLDFEDESDTEPKAKSRRAGKTGKKASPRRKPRTKSTSNAARSDELPPMNMLERDSATPGGADARLQAQIIKDTLDSFNVPVQVVNIEPGPTVTQFGVRPGEIERAGQKRRIPVRRILNLSDDLALALAAPSIRIEAPVPGRPYVGIEVPNAKKSMVGLRSLLESAEFAAIESPLGIALGRGTSGRVMVADLTAMPHLLIAGATGSGKSVCINAIIMALLMNNGPDTLRVLMVDPKKVELPGYNGIPHLIAPVVTDTDEVVGALTWATLQMDDRYRLFREAGARNISDYNRKISRRKNAQPLPYIVIIIDELADLMMVAPDEVERYICRLAQMARATGIHLILATQRPSVDVVTGLIKANFPARIAFAVSSSVDSRVILDGPGAEKLLGRGDMLFMRPDQSKLQRIQGCFVSDKEIQIVVRFWKQRAQAGENEYESAVVAPWVGLMDRQEDGEELILDAIDVLRGQRRASASFLQRRLHIGYPRAARLIDELEERGVVGPDEGRGSGREVLLDDDDEDEF